MPQITRTSLSIAVCLSLLVLALSGCGDVNSQANLDPATGKHAAGWLLNGHNTAAKADLTGCAECHGEDLTGGIAKVSCIKVPGCHIDSTTSPHPALWGQVAYAMHPGYVAQNGTLSCAAAACHGANLLGGASAPSCDINCHRGGSAAAPQIHAWGAISATTAADITGHSQWLANNQVNGHFVYATCRNAVCHGATLQGVWLSGPACTRCHNGGPPAE